MFQARQNAASPEPGGIRVYEWPGRFVEHGHGEFYARIRQECWQVEHQQIQGTATAMGIAPGHRFTLTHAPFFSDNGDYLTIAADYQFEENRYASGEDNETVHCTDFTVIPADVVFRPAQRTEWPRTYGPQTAKVVGPEGETIWTDKYGRIKVKFHWDRLGKGDDTSSCWVRVSSAWAGQGFGGVQIPRVGDEVVIDFINGDPDRPIVTGRVYNEAKMPPWALPAAATQMGFLSRSKDGSPDNANALRFEDKKGQEQVWIHAERNMDTEVEHNETHFVGNDRQKTVNANETTQINKNRTETVEGNETITVHSNRTETVDQNENITIGQNQSSTVQGHQIVKINKTKTETIQLASLLNVGLAQNTNIGAAYLLNVGAGWVTNVAAMQMHNVGYKYSLNAGRDITLNSGTSVEIEAENKITLVCGESMIVMEENGTITLSANKIKLVGEKMIDIDGTQVDIN